MNILLIGRMGSGKTTIANKLSDRDHYSKASLATALKNDVVKHKGRPIDKATDRFLLQRYGQFKRSQDKDYWCKQLAKNMRLDYAKYVIDDCRFLNEVEFFKRLGFVTVRLRIPSAYRIQRLVQRDGKYDGRWELDISEQDLKGYKADITIDVKNYDLIESREEMNCISEEMYWDLVKELRDYAVH